MKIQFFIIKTRKKLFFQQKKLFFQQKSIEKNMYFGKEIN